jgi:hypothetical protein
MGRGSRHLSASITAQSLLFGKRDSLRLMPADVRKARNLEMDKLAKKRVKNKEQTVYKESFDEAADEVTAGNFSALSTLPDSRKGFKAIEKQSLRLLVDKLIFLSAHLESESLTNNPNLLDLLVSDPADIKPFIDLRDRLISHQSPASLIYQMEVVITSNAALSSCARAATDLMLRAEEIGPLPETALDNRFEGHFLRYGHTLCGAPTSNYDPDHPRSPLSCRLSCDDCRDRLNEADLLSPDQWSKSLSNQKLNTWSSWGGLFSSSQLGFDPKTILDISDQNLRQRINENMLFAVGAEVFDL